MYIFQIWVILNCEFFHIFRSWLQRTSQKIDDAGDEQGNDLEEVTIDPEFRGRYGFAEVVGVYT